MRRRSKIRDYAVSVFVVLGLVLTSGCETVPKKFKEEVSGIKSRVDTLETKVEGVEARQEGIERATTEQAQTIDDLKGARQRSARTNVSAKMRSKKPKGRMKEIQACLKNAGFYNGKIDGIKGRQTTGAIKEFQQANGLKVDGIVGAQTWDALARHASAGGEESYSK